MLRKERQLYLRAIEQAAEENLDFRLWGILVPEKQDTYFQSGSEIAEQLGIKPDSMRMRYTRAKRKVAKALLAKGFSPEDLF